mgnify:CR=1 FL=1
MLHSSNRLYLYYNVPARAIRGGDSVDICAFQQRAQRYVRHKGVPQDVQEDLISLMVLEVLEHPTKPVNLRFLYLHAYDQLDPRHATGTGARVRASAVTASASLNASGDTAWEAGLSATAAPEQWLMATDLAAGALWAGPLQRGPLRAMVLLIQIYGYQAQEVALLFGVTPSRVAQLMQHVREALALREIPATDLLFPDLAWEVAWLTLT